MKDVLGGLIATGENLLTAGTGTEFNLDRRSRIIFLNAVTMAGGVMIALFSVIGFFSGNLRLAEACAIAALVVFANFSFIRRTKRFTAGAVVDCAVIFLFYYYLVLTGGESGSGVLWIMTYPLITLFLLGPVGGTIISGLFLIAVAVALFLPSLNVSRFPALYSARVVGTFFFIWVFALIYELVRRASQEKLQAVNARLTKVTDELVAEKKQSDDILSNVREGIFLLSRELRIGEAYSAHLESIFEGGALAGKDFLGLVASTLAERERAGVADYFDLLVSGTVNEDLIAEINPLSDATLTLTTPEGATVSKRLRFAFTRIASLASPYPILAVVSDVTEEYELQRRLTEEEAEHRREMEGLFQVVHVDPVMMREFIADTESELETVNDLMRSENPSRTEVLQALYQSAHAIKGNAALLGLNRFSEKVHDFEEAIKEKLQAGHEWRDLLEFTLSLAAITRELETLKALIDQILRFQTETKSASLADSSLLRYSIEKIVRRESSRTGVLATVSFDGFGRKSIPDEYRKLVKDILIQLIRNSFAHGLESPELRRAAGKAEEGRLSLSVEWGSDTLTLRYSDDGRGLNFEKIRQKARSLEEFAGIADSLGPGDLVKLLFRPGFSTAESLDLSAGRGVGMALVKTRVNKAGGRIAVKSAPGKYLEFAITLPFPQSAQAVS